MSSILALFVLLLIYPRSYSRGPLEAIELVLLAENSPSTFTIDFCYYDQSPKFVKLAVQYVYDTPPRLGSLVSFFSSPTPPLFLLMLRMWHFGGP